MLRRGGLRVAGWVARFLLPALALLAPSAVQAGALRVCDNPPTLTATQQDRLLRTAVAIRRELAGSGEPVALVARSGSDLSRFHMRYSHSGLSLRDAAEAPWSVRQLYYACDEQRPRLFDQGLSAFVLGTGNPDLGYVSVLLLPEREATALTDAVRDNARALALLGARYSANAYAFSTTYQNCNQWVAELLALAWAPLASGAAADTREAAQRWLAEQGYVPALFEVHNPLLALVAAFVPWLHSDDHPPEAVQQLRYRVSMPQAIEDFVHRTVPDAQRIEFCHDTRHLVVRRGWAPLADGCEPAEGDTVLPW